MGESQSPFNNLIAGLIRAADLWNGLPHSSREGARGEVGPGMGAVKEICPKTEGDKIPA